MSTIDQNSEAARLVSSNSNTKPSYVNLFSNVCSLIILLLISYCCFKDGVHLFSFHPIFMTIGSAAGIWFFQKISSGDKLTLAPLTRRTGKWLLFMTSAVNAVTPGDLATEWMPIRLRSARHWVLQVLTGIIVLVAFLIIILNKVIHDKPHFSSLHAKFGLASFILMIITQFGGLCVLYSLKFKHYVAPIYTKLIHASAGLITFSLGIITILLGIFSNWWTFGEFLRYITLILVLIVMICTILRPSLKIFFRLKERIEN